MSPIYPIAALYLACLLALLRQWLAAPQPVRMDRGLRSWLRFHNVLKH